MKPLELLRQNPLVRDMKGTFRRSWRRWGDPLPHVRRNTLAVRTLEHLQIAMGWTESPLLEGEHLHTYRGVVDLNDRPLRDAEVIASACCNGQPTTILEIGTAHGATTALMARNAPSATIYTVNLPPDEASDAGKNITFAPSESEIGRIYRAQNCSNVVQILANTKYWKPDFGPIDVAFVDGCHDADFVYNDTKNALTKCRPGSLLMWHDFHPGLIDNFHWIGEVCAGIERLYSEGLLRERILHLQDSWVGLYRVP